MTSVNLPTKQLLFMVKEIGVVIITSVGTDQLLKAGLYRFGVMVEPGFGACCQDMRSIEGYRDGCYSVLGPLGTRLKFCCAYSTGNTTEGQPQRLRARIHKHKAGDWELKVEPTYRAARLFYRLSLGAMMTGSGYDQQKVRLSILNQMHSDKSWQSEPVVLPTIEAEIFGE